MSAHDAGLALRLGAPPDFEAGVVVAGFDRPPLSWRIALERRPYAELVDALDAGTLDVALVPVHLYAARLAARVELVPGMALGSDGTSSTARLWTAAPLASLRHIASRAPDHAAEAAVAALFHASGRAVEVVSGPPAGSVEDTLHAHGAVLVCGDEAACRDAPGGVQTIDVGAAWRELTGLPVVSAVWAACPGRVNRDTYALLHGARTRGRQHAGALAAEHAAAFGLPAPERLVAAVESAVSYRLGRRQLDGLNALWSAVRGLPGGAEVPEPRFLPLAQGSACHRWAAERRRRTS